jgi:hypothetical protein
MGQNPFRQQPEVDGMKNKFAYEQKLNDGSRLFSERPCTIPDGRCLLITPGGTEYLGTFVNGKKDGEFLIKQKDAEIHCSFQNDSQVSFGTISYRNGDFYEGRMEDCKPNGMGILKFHDGIEFRGDFENGLLDGLDCEIHYPNGDVYKGHFSKGVRYTDGTYTKGSQNN